MKGEVLHITRQANFAVEVFSDPTQFETPRDFLAAISEVLTNLCEIKGVEPKPFPEEWVR